MNQISRKRIDTIFLISIILLFSSSCSDKRDFETYFRYTGLEIQDSYEIDSITQVGFTDWTLKAYIRITDNDKKRILNKLKNERKFHFVTNERFYYDNFFQEGDSVHGFIMDSKYYFGIYENRYAKINDKRQVEGYQTYDFQLDTISNKLLFKYEYE